MRRLRRHLPTAATLLVAAAWFVCLRPVSLGGSASYVIVRGTSMTGTLAPGDLVVANSAGEYQVGDLIVYRIPEGVGEGGLIVHRIIGGDAANGFITQGDANPHPDSWHPRPADIAGRVQTRIPGFGNVVVAGSSPIVLGSLWALTAFILVLGYTDVRRRWRYAMDMGLAHWPLAPNEAPRWEVQALFRELDEPEGRHRYQTWSRSAGEWIDVLATDDAAGRANWFGGGRIEFGDPMVVETTEDEVLAFIDGRPGPRGGHRDDGLGDVAHRILRPSAANERRAA